LNVVTGGDFSLEPIIFIPYCYNPTNASTCSMKEERMLLQMKLILKPCKKMVKK